MRTRSSLYLLVDEARDGRAAALDDLRRRYIGRLRGLVSALLAESRRDEGAAERFLEDFLRDLARKLESFAWKGAEDTDESFDSWLIQAVKRDMIGLLLSKYERPMKSFIRAQSRTKQNAFVDDVWQATCVVAWRKSGSYPWAGEARFLAYLRTVARHLIRDIERRERQKRAGNIDSGSSQTDWFEQIPDPAATPPSKTIRRKDRIRILLESLDLLNPDERWVLCLRYLEGQSVKETARIMGRTEGAVKMLCRRAIRKLRDFLGDSFVDSTSR
jgi:RNA polymerase sigma-70 factor (ECF subfamily)